MLYTTGAPRMDLLLLLYRYPTPLWFFPLYVRTMIS